MRAKKIKIKSRIKKGMGANKTPVFGMLKKKVLFIKLVKGCSQGRAFAYSHGVFKAKLLCDL